MQKPICFSWYIGSEEFLSFLCVIVSIGVACLHVQKMRLMVHCNSLFCLITFEKLVILKTVKKTVKRLTVATANLCFMLMILRTKVYSQIKEME